MHNPAIADKIKIPATLTSHHNILRAKAMIRVVPMHTLTAKIRSGIKMIVTINTPLTEVTANLIVTKNSVTAMNILIKEIEKKKEITTIALSR